jgi:hypothetical protein
MLLSHERRNGTLLPKLVCKSKIAAIATPNNQVAMSSSALIIGWHSTAIVMPRRAARKTGGWCFLLAF